MSIRKTTFRRHALRMAALMLFAPLYLTLYTIASVAIILVPRENDEEDE